MTYVPVLQAAKGLTGVTLILLISACATTPPDNNTPHEGNVLPESYQHVSGAKQRRSAHAETALGIAGATGAAVGHVAAGGTPQNFVLSTALPTEKKKEEPGDANRRTSCFKDEGTKP